MQANLIYNFVNKHGVTKHQFVTYFAAALVIFYFLLSTIFGQKGLVSLSKLSQQIEKREMVKQELLSTIESKKNLVEGMSPESLDLDLLDEQSRKVLGYVGKNEVVIYPNQNEKK
jgi:cell division protein FtsB